MKELGYKLVEELADAIHKTKAERNRLPGIEPVFRLHPPSKRFKGKVKRSYTTGGVKGYKGGNINNLTKNFLRHKSLRLKTLRFR